MWCVWQYLCITLKDKNLILVYTTHGSIVDQCYSFLSTALSLSLSLCDEHCLWQLTYLFWLRIWCWCVLSLHLVLYLFRNFFPFFLSFLFPFFFCIILDIHDSFSSLLWKFDRYSECERMCATAAWAANGTHILQHLCVQYVRIHFFSVSFCSFSSFFSPVQIDW